VDLFDSEVTAKLAGATKVEKAEVGLATNSNFLPPVLDPFPAGYPGPLRRIWWCGSRFGRGMERERIGVFGEKRFPFESKKSCGGA
jgi:hypothetical protein